MVLRMKQKAEALIREQDAAMTVLFLTVGTAMLILFLAVFNLGRYFLAVSQTETALEASAASVLSYYHPRLTGEMGLFALDTRDLSLEIKGRQYFSDNLGREGTAYGQKVLNYTLSFPVGGRLNLDEILAAQALDTQRIKGWTDIARDLLEFLGAADWLKGLRASGDTEGLGEALGLPAAAVGDPDSGDTDWADGAETETEPGGDWEKPAWMTSIEDMAGPRPDGRMSFLQLMAPWPPSDSFENRKMPHEGVWSGIIGLFNRQEDHWQGLFDAPAETVGDDSFLPETTEQITGFLTVLTEGLEAALYKLGNKIVFNDYLLNEMDFMTNKPVLNRYLARGEVEYILCGFNNSWNNIRSVAFQLFLLRTCLHVLKSLIDREIVDEVTLAAAAIEGAIKGSGEVEKLFAGEKISAFPGTKFTMTYKDHLRILLLLQKEADQRRALQELTQVNLWHWAGGSAGGGPGAGAIIFGTGGFADFNLNRYATEVRIVVETEVPLWPFGAVRIRREGAMGYDKPFALLPV